MQITKVNIISRLRNAVKVVLIVCSYKLKYYCTVLHKYLICFLNAFQTTKSWQSYMHEPIFTCISSVCNHCTWIFNGEVILWSRSVPEAVLIIDKADVISQMTKNSVESSCEPTKSKRTWKPKNIYLKKCTGHKRLISHNFNNLVGGYSWFTVWNTYQLYHGLSIFDSDWLKGMQ